MKGRDIFGLLGVLPGVQDTNLNRDFSSWTFRDADHHQRRPSQNKDVRVDGINIVDEGGCGTAFVNLNMDAVNEVQVIANGYTAENGRNNGGLINVVTKSGTNTFKGSAWYNGRRDKFNENDYFRKANNQAKPLYDVNISGYSFGGPLVIPGVIDSRKTTQEDLLLRVAGIHRRRAADVTTRANLPTAPSATATSRRHGSRTARFSRSSTRGPARRSPDNIIPARTRDGRSSAASTRSDRRC